MKGAEHLIKIKIDTYYLYRDKSLSITQDYKIAATIY